MTILLIAILTIGLAGCGGDEPARTVSQPAPQPAPPPFQPQPIEVTLGASGDTVTLMTTESGGFTLDGEAFESGGNVTAGNGGMYTLTLADGNWTAQFDAHEIMVTLGMSEEMVTITRAEDGSYWLGEVAVQSGTTVHTAENGNEYVLMITTTDDGAITWMATYRAPMIAVTLGLSGDTVTIEKAEDGSYRLDDMVITSGETTTMAGNGNAYALTMGEDGMWMAEYRAMVVDVMLGMSGETVSVHRAEDGTYQLGETVVESGVTMAMSSNGNQYRLMMGEDGMWMAEYVPETGTVTVGTLGVTLETVQAEDGSWTVVSPDTGETETLTDGATFMRSGNTYTLSVDSEGNWMATYREETVTVTLGMSGETVMLTKREDGSYWMGEMQVEDGVTMVTAENGNQYRLMMGEDGMWMAPHDAPETLLALGTSGTTVTLVRQEDGTYTLNGETFTSGGEVTAENGNVYTVTMTDGAWMAQYQPESMEIEGTGGLMAVLQENGQGYFVDGALLPASGMGDIDTDSAGSYRVRMQDGMLMGTRLDNVKISAAKFKTKGLSAQPAMLGDDKSTQDINEANTALVVAGENYSFADLLGSGVSQTEGKSFVAEARMKLEGIREKIVQILDVFEKDSERDEQIEKQWGTGSSKAKTNVKAVLESVFGDDNDKLGSLFGTDTEPDDDKALGEIDDLIQALTSAEELAAALGDDGALEGVVKANEAGTIFAAKDTKSTVTYGLYGNTRFGTITRTKRSDAVSDAEYSFDTTKEANDKEQTGETGERGAFAFGVTEATARANYVQTAGTANYAGRTLAVSGTDQHYAGDITVRINFQSEKVDGLISNLTNADGEAWQYLFGTVHGIVLPQGSLNAHGVWKQGPNATALIDYGWRVGASQRLTVDSTFEGRLLGGNSGPAAGSEVVGVWSAGSNPESKTYLAGGFGAGRVADEPVERPAVDDGTVVEATLLGGNTTLKNGQLTFTHGIRGWYPATVGGGGRRSHGKKSGASGQPQPHTLTEAFSLKTLLDAAGTLYSHDGQSWVPSVRDEITKLRDRIVAKKALGGDLTDSIKADWVKAQDALLYGVFYDRGGSWTKTGTSITVSGDNYREHLPFKVNQSDGTSYHDTTPPDVEERLDQIIEALSSAQGLAAAFDPVRDGIFTVADGDEQKSWLDVEVGTGKRIEKVQNTSASAIFNQGMYEVQIVMEQTDYTRFGNWRTRWSGNALRTEINEYSRNGWAFGDIDSFAYSSLPTAVAATKAQQPQGQATYEGKTVANVGSQPYVGAARVEVRWFGDDTTYDNELTTTDPAEIGGNVTTVISDLRHVTTGDYMYHDGKEVRELVFGRLLFSTGDSAKGTVSQWDGAVEDGDYLLEYTSPGTFNQFNGTAYVRSRIRVGIEYRDRTQARVTGDKRASLNEHSFAFVGNSPDGQPLGVIGKYALRYAATPDFGQDKNKFGATAAGSMNTPLPLLGAYGADLAP